MLNLLLVRTIIQPISLESNAMHASDVVAALAKHSGEPLSCSPSVANEPLVLHLDAADYAKAKENLAWAVDGTWRQEEDRIILDRSSSLAAQQERAEAKKVQDLLAKILGDTTLEMKSAPLFDDKIATSYITRDWAKDVGNNQHLKEINRLRLSSPTFRQGINWIKSIGTAKLASMQIGARTVYSDAPTALQQPLAASKSVIKTLMSQADILNERGRALGKTAGYQAYVDYQSMGGPGNPAQYHKTLFVIKRLAFARFQFELVSVDQQGQLIIAGQGTIPNRLGSNISALPATGKRLEISDKMRRLGRVFNDLGVSYGGGGPDYSYTITFSEREGMPFDWGVGEHLRKPYSSDPIGYFAGPLLNQAAKNKDKQFIGTIPDSALIYLARAMQGQVRTDDDLIAFLSRGLDQIPICELREEADWRMIRPSFPSYSYASRFNRAAAQLLIQNMRTKGEFSLEDACEYAKVSPGPWTFSSPDLVLLGHAVPEVPRFTIEETLQGHLSTLLGFGMPGKNIESGVRRFDSLPPTVQSQIRSWIVKEDRLTQTISNAAHGMGPSNALEMETTEVGTRSDLTLDIQVHMRPFIRAQVENGPVMDMSVGSLAFEEIQPENPVGDMLPRRKFSSYQVVNRRSYTFSISVGGVPITRFGSEYRKDISSKPGARRELPQKILRDVDEAKKGFGGGL
ncbi:MAG: hypothetical protein ABL949_05350 [Fimbriimonadaceae bacterium]